MVETFVPKNLKGRSDLHLARKIWHATGVFIIFCGWNFFDKQMSLILIGIAWLLFVPADFLRQSRPELNLKLTKLFRPIIRSSEVNRIAGTTFLLSGVVLIFLLFNKGVVSIALLFLAFADPIASYVGIKYGKDKLFGHKSVQGFLAAFVVCALSCYFYLAYNNVSQYVYVVSLIAGLIGALAELIPIGKLDDNFTMPVVSGMGLSVLFYIFGYFAYFN